jgi:hypothetical protein
MTPKVAERGADIEAGKIATETSANEAHRKWKRREHYVPRFYLRQFGEPLFVFDKQTGDVFSTTSKNIAFEEGFYDLDPLIDLEAQITENENLMRDGLNELLDKMNPLSLALDTRIRIALFIALQFVRTKEYRAWIKEAGGKMMTELVKDDPEFKNLDFKVIMKDELAQALQAELIVSDAVPQFGYILGNSLWTLLVNRTKVPFWTSDNPVALFNPIDYGDMSGLGFAVRGIQTHFPLSGKLLLLILDPRSYPAIPIKLVKDPRTILYENEFQLYNASRFVISSEDDFSGAKKLRDRDETLRKPHEQVTVRTIGHDGRSIIQLSTNTAKRQSKQT